MMAGMRVVQLPKGRGKTEALLRWMQDAPEDEHRVFVAFSHQEAMRVLRLSRDRGLGLESWQFVSVDEARNQGAWSTLTLFRGGRVVLAIDNLDIWLGMHFGREVAVVTTTT